jgi:YVTN family beta-propeller protein
VTLLDAVGDSMVTTFRVGKRPWGIGLTRDGRKLYAANGPGNDVTVINTETLAVMRTISVGSVPWGVALGPKY